VSRVVCWVVETGSRARWKIRGLILDGTRDEGEPTLNLSVED
jgi:hypothetical protein